MSGWNNGVQTGGVFWCTNLCPVFIPVKTANIEILVSSAVFRVSLLFCPYRLSFHLEEEVSQLWGNSYRDKACWNENELITMEHGFSTSHLGARVNQLLALGPLVLAAFWQCFVEWVDNPSWSHFRWGMASNYYLVVLCISVLPGYK